MTDEEKKEAKKQNQEKPKEKPKEESEEESEEEAKQEQKKTEEKPKRERIAQLPPPTLPQLVDTFFLQAMISLGKQMNPMSKKYERDLTIAQYQIGILEVLEQKTKGNLSEDEDKHLEQVLHTLRMAYLDEAGKGEKPGEKK